MSFHDLETAGSIHVPYNWEYANAAARTGASGFVSDDLGKLARQTDDNSLWMLTAVTPTWISVGGGTSFDPTWTHSAGRNANVTNVYLRAPGNVGTNDAGYVQPWDATIVAISAATRGNETWTAEIRKNDAVAVIASLSLSAVNKAYSASLSVNVSAGDEIQFYCNGTNINRPEVTIWLKRR